MDDGQVRLGPAADGPLVVLLIGCPDDFVDILEIIDGYVASKSVSETGAGRGRRNGPLRPALGGSSRDLHGIFMDFSWIFDDFRGISMGFDQF